MTEKLFITNEQAKIIGQQTGQAIAERFVQVLKNASFHYTESGGIKNLTEILGTAIGKAMKG